MITIEITNFKSIEMKLHFFTPEEVWEEIGSLVSLKFTCWQDRSYDDIGVKDIYLNDLEFITYPGYQNTRIDFFATYSDGLEGLFSLETKNDYNNPRAEFDPRIVLPSGSLDLSAPYTYEIDADSCTYRYYEIPEKKDNGMIENPFTGRKSWL